MKKTGLILVTLAVIACVIIFIVIKNTNSNQTIILPVPSKDSIKIESNPWKEYSTIPPGDTINVIKVQYDQKYGRSVLLYCTAVFENTKENKYRCIAPWLDKQDIEKSNINDFKVTKVLRKEMK